LINQLLILTQSYPHVKNVLFLIDHYINEFTEIKLLVFQNRYLFDFFNEINNEHFNSQIDIRFIPKYPTIDNNNFLKHNLIAEKMFLYKYYRLTCGNTTNHTVYFFSKSFTDYGYYFLKILHKNNKIIHMQDPGCDVYKITDGKPDDFKSYFKLIYTKLLLGRHIGYGETGRKNFHKFFTISEKYYNKIVEKTILQDERDVLQRNFILSKYALAEYSNYKVIYFDKDVVKDGLCDDLQFQNEIEEIFQIISEFVPSDKIGRKYKPNRTTDYNRGRLKIGKIIPDHIPAELLYNENIDIYFGITSIALSNIEKGNVISLAYLITFIDPQMREGSVQNQEKRKKGKKICYPKSLNELRTQLSLFLQ
jgi:hypothetical protein